MQLKTWQQSVVRALEQEQVSEELLAHIQQGGEVSTQTRLSIYRDSLMASKHQALVLTYPRVIDLVGEAYFNHLAQQYVIQTPSMSPSLDDYGAGLADFIDQCPQKALPYLSDVARLEWDIQQVLYGVDDTRRIDFHCLARCLAQQEDQIVLDIVSNARFLISDYPLWSIWQLIHQPERQDTVDYNSGGCHLLIYRPQDEVLTIELSPQEGFILRSGDHRLDLSDMADKVASLTHPWDMGAVIAELTRKQVFADFSRKRSE